MSAVVIGKGQRGEATQRIVRTGRVVIDPPGLDDGPDITKRIEQMLVEALVSEAAIKALPEGVMSRLSGRDIMPYLRQSSSVFKPLSCSLRIPMICSSEIVTCACGILCVSRTLQSHGRNFGGWVKT